MDAGLPTGDADRRGARSRGEWQLCDTSRRTLAPLAPDALVHDRGDRPAWSLKLQVLRELAQQVVERAQGVLEDRAADGFAPADLARKEHALADDEAMVAAVRESPEMTGRSLAELVSTPEAYRLPAIGESIGTLAVLDLGPGGHGAVPVA